MPRFGLTLLVAAPLSLAAAQGFAADKLSAQDETFMREAAQGGLAEVQDAQLAQQKGTGSEVKQFAGRMVTDHTKANNDLQQIARVKGVTPPAEPSSAQRSAHEKLGKLSGAQFDREYMQNQVSDHEKDVTLFRKEADSGQDPQLKAFAQKYLPTIQEHLQMAKSIKS